MEFISSIFTNQWAFLAFVVITGLVFLSFTYILINSKHFRHILGIIADKFTKKQVDTEFFVEHIKKMQEEYDELLVNYKKLEDKYNELEKKFNELKLKHA